MALPTIVAPPQVPPFLADGHEFDEDSVYAAVALGTGHSRLRRVRQATERIVNVSWYLDAEAMQAVDAWYENELQAGALPFAAHVANQNGTGAAWWSARWVSFEIEMLHLGDGRLTGALYLFGEPSDEPPELGSFAVEFGIELRSRAVVTTSPYMTVEFEIELAGEAAE